MSNQTLFYLFVIVASCAISSVQSIKCYHCDSRTSLSCSANDFDKTENKVEVDAFGNECAYCTTAIFKILGSKVIQRKCWNEDFDRERYGLNGDNDCAPAWFYDIEGEICVCDKDKCNVASGIVFSAVTLICSMVAYKLLL